MTLRIHNKRTRIVPVRVFIISALSVWFPVKIKPRFIQFVARWHCTNQSRSKDFVGSTFLNHFSANPCGCFHAISLLQGPIFQIGIQCRHQHGRNMNGDLPLDRTGPSNVILGVEFEPDVQHIVAGKGDRHLVPSGFRIDIRRESTSVDRQVFINTRSYSRSLLVMSPALRVAALYLFPCF